ncbi:MAG TPA: Gfo/Idh/MocA family oxidoreductase [Bauldia sp.]|nr:Gfo/Idh/MocA family oxidoreductase [Bauldia sp.]
MVADSIRTAVVGAGAFGRNHVRHYAANPAAALVAVVDADLARAEALAAGHGARAFRDHRDLIGRIDAASVAAPATLHHAIARDLIAAGIHVLIEKPLATTAADAANLVTLARKAGVVLAVGHVERFSPAIAELERRVEHARRITAVRRTKWSGRSADVDVVLDLMIHDIDLALTLTRSPVASVSASGVPGVSGQIDEAEAWLTFANGAIATLSASRIADSNERRISVTEPANAYAVDLSGPSLTVTQRRIPGAMPNQIALTQHDNLGAEIAAFLAAVAGGPPVAVDGVAGLAAVDIAERIRTAIAENSAAVDAVTA